MKKIGIIGAGNMGGAFYKALAGKFEENALRVFDRNNEKLKNLNVKKIVESVDELVKNSDVIILAVKPQVCDDLFSKISVETKEKLVISIMAGVSVAKLKDLSGSSRVVRAMPNLGVQIKKGVTGWFASEEVTSEDKKIANKIFEAGGESIEVESEKMINPLTAISGSGPAYFFYLTEMLQKKAESLGFSAEDAKKMAEVTFVGSAELFAGSNKSAEEWRQAVSSKGGSTVEAINHMQENKFAEIFGEAIEKAKKRWEDL